MKKGTRVKIGRSHIKFMQEHLIEFYKGTGPIRKTDLTSLAVDTLLILGTPYKATFTGRFGMDGCPEVRVDFGKGIVSEHYYEKRDIRRA